MSKARLLAPWVGEDDERSALYHVISRINGRSYLLGKAQEKEQFVKIMRRYEAFCGVRVLTYCIMSNHFHLMVEVPPACEQTLSDEDLLQRLEALYADGAKESRDSVELIRQQLAALSTAYTKEGKEAYKKLRESFTHRMWDLGMFMKAVKQQFSSWYNKKHGRVGGLWEARYKSVLVENGYAARTIAAYIDLNPVRAGMVTEPRKYRWCGYAEAIAGGQLARNGISRVLSEMDSDTAQDGWAGAADITHYDWRSVSKRYRMILFEDGASFGDATGEAGRGQKKRRGFTQKELEKEQSREGELSIAELVGSKTRYLVDGAVIGSKQWVNEVIEGLKGDFLSADRKTNGSKAGGALKGSPLWSLRRLRDS